MITGKAKVREGALGSVIIEWKGTLRICCDNAFIDDNSQEVRFTTGDTTVVSIPYENEPYKLINAIQKLKQTGKSSEVHTGDS